MNKTRENKRTLMTSAIVLLLCIVALIGATAAWFTSTASNTGNKIQAGTLQVDLLKADSDVTKAASYTSIAKNEKAIFSSDVLWEPGQTQYAYLQVQNKGSLDLKYNMTITVRDLKTNQVVSTPMAGAFTYAIVPSGHTTPTSAVTSWADTLSRTPLETGNLLTAIQSQQGQATSRDGSIAAAQGGKLTASQSDYFLIAIHMDESAGNDYQGGALEVDLVVNAGQLASEYDGFGSNTYDALAELPVTVSFPTVKGEVTSDQKVTTQGVIKEATVAKAAVNGVFNDMKVDGASSNELTLTLDVAEQGRSSSTNPTTLDVTTTVDLSIDMTAVMKSVKNSVTTTETKNVTALDDYVIIEMNIGKSLLNVSATHNGQAMVKVPGADAGLGTYSYDSTTGILTIKTKTFSPFAVTYTKPCPEIKITQDTNPSVVVAEMTLAEFRDSVNAGNTYAGYTATLQKNVDLNNAEWEPISNYAYGAGSGKLFAGTFDGANHTIDKLKVSNNSKDALGNTSDLANGLFGQIAGATIRNLKVSNVSVTSTGLNAAVCALRLASSGGTATFENVHVLSGSVVSADNASGISAFCTGRTNFSNCSNAASVSGYNPGGIVGVLRDQNGSGTCSVTGCTNTGSIIDTVGSGDGAAGVVGKVEWYQGAPIVIDSCSNSGSVTATATNVYAGGILGIANGNNADGITITNCRNTGTIDSSVGYCGRAGGIIGKHSNSYLVSKCINLGGVKGYQGAGGISGWSDAYGLRVEYCYNAGSVQATQIGVDGDSNPGGAGGIAQGSLCLKTVKYSLNSSAVTASVAVYQITGDPGDSCYYYDNSTLKTAAGETVSDINAALTALNTGLETSFWGNDNGVIKPLSLIQP